MKKVCDSSKNYGKEQKLQTTKEFTKYAVHCHKGSLNKHFYAQKQKKIWSELYILHLIGKFFC
jgi:hypothetical protein